MPFGLHAHRRVLFPLARLPSELYARSHSPQFKRGTRNWALALLFCHAPGGPCQCRWVLGRATTACRPFRLILLFPSPCYNYVDSQVVGGPPGWRRTAGGPLGLLCHACDTCHAATPPPCLGGTVGSRLGGGGGHSCCSQQCQQASSPCSIRCYLRQPLPELRWLPCPRAHTAVSFCPRRYASLAACPRVNTLFAKRGATAPRLQRSPATPPLPLHFTHYSRATTCAPYPHT